MICNWLMQFRCVPNYYVDIKVFYFVITFFFSFKEKDVMLFISGYIENVGGGMNY